MDKQLLGSLSLAAGIVAALFLVASFATAGSPVGPPIFLGPALLAALAAIALGVAALPDRTAPAGLALGHGVAVAGLVLGLVYATLVVVIPILLLILFLIFGWPWYASYTGCGSSGASSSHEGCCGSSGSGEGGCCCCGPGCSNCDPGKCCSGCGDCNCSCGNACTGCGSCGCGDCGCGNCGCGGCGGCGCAAPLTLTGAAAAGWSAAHVSRLFAHHPDLPDYDADVYRVRGARLCVGCFTTHPAFLLATLAFLVAPPGLAWSSALLVGAALACLQAISSAGLARRQWMKVIVKTALGVGLALVVLAAREAPWPPAARAGILLAALGLAMASAIPRARRMRRCACAQSATSTP